MRVELWDFKRCCFCLPLRYGLLTSGYLKLMTSTLLLASLINDAVIVILDLQEPKLNASVYLHLMMYFVIVGTICVVLLGDVILAIVFLVGCHKKCVKLLKVYNYYTIGMLALYVVLFLVFIGLKMYRMIPYTGLLDAIVIHRIVIAAGILNICFQVYMIFMNRSEILKLESNRKFRFQNNCNEAQCTMEDGENAINGTSVEKHEPVDQNVAINENEENHYVEKKTNGNYVKLNN